MKKLILTGLLVLFTASFVNAELYEVNFSCAAGSYDGFIFYERVGDNRVTILDGIAADVRTFDVEMVPPVGQCRTFFMATVTDDRDGPYSEGFGLCPDSVMPDLITISTDAVYEITIRQKTNP